MLKMGIKDWIARIDRQFEANLCDEIVIHGNGLTVPVERKTKEITNFEFCLEPEIIVEKVFPPNEEEWVERDFILSRSLEMYTHYSIGDLNSRQAAFVNNYDGADNHCISYFHHYVRNGKYCMNVYVRSMNYRENFTFDCQTFNLAYQEIYEKLKDKVELGFIKVFVFSLHIYV